MLSDPLVIKVPTLSAHSALTIAESDSFARVDAGDGSARYTCPAVLISTGGSGSPATLKIAHSVSNENKPAKTDRTLARLDFLVKDAEGREMTAFVYAVVGVPRGALTSADGDELSALIMTQVLVGVLAVSSTAATLDETKLTRILAGES